MVVIIMAATDSKKNFMIRTTASCLLLSALQRGKLWNRRTMVENARMMKKNSSHKNSSAKRPKKFQTYAENVDIRTTMPTTDNRNLVYFRRIWPGNR